MQPPRPHSGYLCHTRVIFDGPPTTLRSPRPGRSGRDRGPTPKSTYGRIEHWFGKFKWDQDAQTYGTPTIWLLSPDGKVLAGPYCRNIYEGPPPELNYTSRDLSAEIEKHLN